MPKINFLFFPHNVGGHFVSWSLYFLSGQKKYLTNKKILDLENIDQFENKKNFHHHQPYRIRGFDDLKNNLNKLENFYHHDIDSINFYLGPINWTDVLKTHFDVTFQNASSDQIQKTMDIVAEDTRKIFEYIQAQDFVLKFFKTCDEDHLNIFYNDRAPYDHNLQLLEDQKEKFQLWQERFFPDIQTKFSDNEIWDQREKIALVLHTESKINWFEFVDQTKPHLCYNTYDLWNLLPEVITEIIDQSGLKVDQCKINVWTQLYNVWRTRHDPSFSRHYDRILEAIVNDHYLCLKRFKLDFFKETLIQHGLIKKYNLNLKTWQLSKFPDNTQDLYRLLEPNIHNI
jgi:hypothetical protein